VQLYVAQGTYSPGFSFPFLPIQPPNSRRTPARDIAAEFCGDLRDGDDGDGEVEDDVVEDVNRRGQGSSGGGGIGGGVFQLCRDTDRGEGGISLTRCLNSPILIDTDGNGFELAPKDHTVLFDLDADGQPELIQWVRENGDEVFLALDRNGNGVVDNGAELFGNNTPFELRPEKRPRHGYAALRQYDRKKLGGNKEKKLLRLIAFGIS